MATVIGASDYKVISDLYSLARLRVIGMKDDLFDSVYQVVLLNSVDPEVDLLSPFWNTYLLNSNVAISDENLLASVRAINSHVIVRGAYTTIDGYFAANPGLLVTQTWADLSRDAGYIIDPIYIEP
jgi:hypothetical protein